jgi:hypothetical protein
LAIVTVKLLYQIENTIEQARSEKIAAKNLNLLRTYYQQIFSFFRSKHTCGSANLLVAF